MDKTYQPKAIETKLYQQWQQQGYFSAQGTGQPYCIILPPPNVTGSLHMGHGFQDTLMDCLSRYHRMQGKAVLWQPGTDHAGIATQMVVERQLQAENKTRHDLGREAFVERVWEWKQESGGNILRQMQRLGASCDWQREKFSMGPEVSKATYEAFIRLYEEGLIYRGQRLVNWDPELKTAISDLEVLSNEEKGSLWHFHYPLTDGSAQLTIATTRPETMLGDTAVAVHPDDIRYQALIGKTITLPLTEREIPIIADEYVDPEFGTGCVKITPAHDFNDYDMGKRHDLPMINILNDDATINDQAPEAYQGLDRFEARKRIIADMETLGLLDQIEPHTLKIPRNERGNAIIEPYLSYQWYVDIKPLAEPAVAAVKTGKVRFIPENYQNLYFSWMNDIQDWCISRQLWWGHRIPAWFDAEGNVYVGMDEATVRSKHQLSDQVELKQEDDVLDTWFTAALWPLSALGWPDKTPELDQFYPSNVMVTGFDIIFFWVARMIMFGLKFGGDVPFHEVYMHGLIRDQDGQKMSKSKGNVLDPIDLIDGIDLDTLTTKRTANMMQPRLKEKVIKTTQKQFPEGIAPHGTDALRFTYCALASTSRDICFDIQRMEGYRNFCNKLWNAARFVLMNVEAHGPFSQCESNLLINQWIWDRLNHSVAAVHSGFAQYRFDWVANEIYEFTWNTYCDWYLEASKAVLNDPNTPEHEKQATRYTLVAVLEQILRLAHPIIPFITEAIWQTVAPLLNINTNSIMISTYPQAEDNRVNAAAEKTMTFLQTMVTQIRTLRSEMNIAPSKMAPLYIEKASPQQQSWIKDNDALLNALAKIEAIHWLDEGDTPPASATVLVENIECHIPMAGLIDVAEEQRRLSKESDKLQAELTRIQGKLSNPNFVDKAPEAVVAKERDKLPALEQQIATITDKLEQLSAL